MNKYPKYKNSGIAWLGEIPEHWEIRRIKYVFKELNNRSETGKEDLLSVSQYTGVTKKSDKVAEGESISNAKTLEGYKIVEKGDLVINIMLAWNGSLGISKYNGIVSPAYCVYRNHIGNERYFGYLFKTKNGQQEFKKQSTGIIDSRLRMYTDSFFDIKTALPPKKEQIKIAHFLDYKIEKINRFIKKKKQLIKLLNEQKTAIINQAVTKGLDPNAQLKDSGIEWLGDIPVHWKVKKLKYGTNILRGKFTPRPRNDPKFYDGDYPFIQTGNITSTGKYIETYNQTLNELGKNVSKEFPINTVVMSVAANIADVAILNFKACFPDSVIGFYPFEGTDTDFLFYQLKNLRAEFYKIAIKSTQYNLNVDRVKNVKIFLPPFLEQQAIVKYIENELGLIDKTISTIQKEITLVEEYKTALIAEAVTGKIDVRKWSEP
ncbi:restriction endonuclease subunit S [Algibacter sp. 2305UL17-15]|uniref:restriction endonuclease subunit S n=1 Tax=Algibacter sp. 2305UL17-15 TaxID=3231268 RepID=UPI003457FF45